MAWSIIASQTANTTLASLAYPGACAIGSVLVAVMRTAVNVAGNTTLVDTLNNTWVQGVNISVGVQGFWLWYVLSCKSTGANTLTISGSNSVANLVIAEFSPAGAVPTAQSQAAATGTSSTPASGSFSASGFSNLIVAGTFNITANSRTISAGTGFIVPANGTSSGNGGLEYALNQPSGSYNPSFTISGTPVNWGCGAIAFSIAGSSGGGWLNTLHDITNKRGLRG